MSGPTVILGGQDRAREIVGLDAAGNGWKRGAQILFTHPVPQGEWVRGPLREVFRDCARESSRFFGWGNYADFLTAGEQRPPQLDDLLPLGKSTLWGAKGLEDALFLPAVGAALRGLRESTFHVNLLPGIREDRRARILYLLNIFLAAVLLIAVAGWGVSHPMKEEMRLRQLQKENQKLEPSVAALRREEEELNLLRKEISAVFMLSERRGEILQILDELSRIVPSGAYLSSLRYLGAAVEVQGSADNASALIPLLERSPLFENVKFIAPSSRGRDGRETFSLRAEIERSQAKEPQP
ncbi:MAG: PilN domain-containing protein [Deltaproteobacteria bacterium]|nr:PilN domain-containing protein [Deltaproteobacteria bacterium]